MWIAIVAVAAAALAAAAYAGMGKLGEMPAQAVIDRPRGVVPDGPVDDAFLAAARLPTATHGYERDAVDAYLREVADGTASAPDEVLFTVVRGGYDMQVVDALLQRPRYERPTAAAPLDDAADHDLMADTEAGAESSEDAVQDATPAEVDAFPAVADDAGAPVPRRSAEA